MTPADIFYWKQNPNGMTKMAQLKLLAILEELMKENALLSEEIVTLKRIKESLEHTIEQIQDES